MERCLEEAGRELEELDRVAKEVGKGIDLHRLSGKEGIEKMRREREEAAEEEAEKERMLKDIEKEKGVLVAFHAARLGELRAKVSEKEKELEKMLKNEDSSQSRKDEEEEVEKEKGSGVGFRESEVESGQINRPVRHSQVEVAANTIRRRLQLKRVLMATAIQCVLHTGAEEENSNPKEISINMLENNLRREPFCLGKKHQRLVARYMVEENTTDYVKFNPNKTQTKFIVETIFKTMVGTYHLKPLEAIREHFRFLETYLRKYKNTLTLFFVGKDRKELLTSAYFEEKVEKLPQSLASDFLPECRETFVLHSVEMSENSEDIDIDEIFTFFIQEKFNKIYSKALNSISSSAKSPMVKKRTLVPGGMGNQLKSGSGQLSLLQNLSSIIEDNKVDTHVSDNILVADTHVSILEKNIDVNGQMLEEGRKEKGENPPNPIEEENDGLDKIGEGFSRGDSEEVSSGLEFGYGSQREEESDGEAEETFVPEVRVLQVETFNGPDATEFIYKLEEIKVSKEVTSVLQKIIFNGDDFFGEIQNQEDNDGEKRDTGGVEIHEELDSPFGPNMKLSKTGDRSGGVPPLNLAGVSSNLNGNLQTENVKEEYTMNDDMNGDDEF